MDLISDSPAEPGHPVPTEAQTTALLSLFEYGRRSGWLLSVHGRRPVDARRRPLPWYTYPAIHFLKDRIASDLDVFEFGSGNSTLWWAARARSVISVENNPAWAQAMQKSAPGNVDVHYISLEPNGSYSRAAASLGKTPFDVIVNDGRDRVNCCFHSIDTLSERGVIIWDNADRERYQTGFDFLAARGFRRIPFVGHGPINVNQWETSVFYRTDNCLGI